jgi:hypothetical protein
MWLSVDPLAHETLQEYQFTGNNPLMYVDPNGLDTVNVTKNGQGRWYVSSISISKGNDVFLVSNGDKTDAYTFNQGEYGNRINYLRLVEDENETFGIFHLSGTKTSGFILEPEGPSTYSANRNKRIPDDSYNLAAHTSSASVNRGKEGRKWIGYPKIYNSQLSPGRGILLHYGTNRKWSVGCLVVGSELSYNNGDVSFTSKSSEKATVRAGFEPAVQLNITTIS